MIYYLSPLQCVLMKNLLYGSIALVVLASCGHGSGSKDSEVISSPASLPAANGLPAQQQPAINNGAVALNPKHGMPGHRCDIPEGAPLNSAPANASANQPVISSPVLGQPAVNSASTVRLNPPHGEPGHDCAVEVGKPLPNQ